MAQGAFGQPMSVAASAGAGEDPQLEPARGPEEA